MWKGVRTTRKFDDFLEEQFQNEDYKRECDNLQPEFAVIRAIVDEEYHKILHKGSQQNVLDKSSRYK